MWSQACVETCSIISNYQLGTAPISICWLLGQASLFVSDTHTECSCINLSLEHSLARGMYEYWLNVRCFSIPVRFCVFLQSVSSLVSHKIFLHSVKLLSAEQDLRIVFNALEGNYALCLLGNLIQMAQIEREGSLREIYFPSFTVNIFLP